MDGEDSLWSTLFNWWRGDYGYLLDGEEMPNEEDRIAAVRSLTSFSDKEIRANLETRRRWFTSLGLQPNECADWLIQLASDYERFVP